MLAVDPSNPNLVASVGPDPRIAAAMIQVLEWCAAQGATVVATLLTRPPFIAPYRTDRSHWQAVADLIESGRFDPDFVVETEEDGRSYLRFGDDVNGRQAAAGDRFL